MICLHTYNYNQEAIIIAKITNGQRHGNWFGLSSYDLHRLPSAEKSHSKDNETGQAWNWPVEIRNNTRHLFDIARKWILFSGDANSRQYPHQGQKSGKNISKPSLSASLPTIHIHPSQFGPTKKNKRLQVRSHQLLSPLYLWFQQFQSLRRDRISRSCRDQISLRLWDTMATQEIHLAASTKSWKLCVNPSNWFEEANVQEWPQCSSTYFNGVAFESSFFSRDHRRKIMPGNSSVWRYHVLQGH